jgi:hypothetical protein
MTAQITQKSSIAEDNGSTVISSQADLNSKPISRQQPSITTTLRNDLVVEKAISILDALSSFKYYSLLASPVDLVSFSDYPLKVPHPQDFSTIRSNLSKDYYKTSESFAKDMRRVVANCLRYNYHSSGATIRQEAKKILYRFETEWAKQFPASKQVRLNFSLK